MLVFYDLGIIVYDNSIDGHNSVRQERVEDAFFIPLAYGEREIFLNIAHVIARAHCARSNPTKLKVR